MSSGLLHVQIANVFVCLVLDFFMCFVILNMEVHFEWDDFGFFFFFPYVQLHLPTVAPLGPLNPLLGNSPYAAGWWLVIGIMYLLISPFYIFPAIAMCLEQLGYNKTRPIVLS